MMNKEYFEKWRANHPNYLKEWRKVHPQYDQEWRKVNREQIRTRLEKYRENHPERRKSEYQSTDPLASSCELCESTLNLHRHHFDYDYPAFFVTVCAKCHKWIHLQKHN